MIEIKNLTKKFGDKIAVDNVSFSVPNGKVVGFLGPNGAGKSTTMRCALNLIEGQSGSCLIDGKKYNKINNPLTQVGAMIDAKAFHKARSPKQHLRMIAVTNHISKKRVDEVLEIAGLSSVVNKKAGGFSLGMAQRIGIAAALLGDPKNLILDEPVNGLDPEGVKWVRDLCRKWAQNGGAVLVSSHLMSEVAQTADDLVIIGKGKIIDQGSVQNIIDKTSGTAIRIVTPELERASSILKSKGIQFSPEVYEGKTAIVTQNTPIEEISQIILTNQLPIFELQQQKNTLEESYMKLTHDSVEYESRAL